jgi:hypothetical protein
VETIPLAAGSVGRTEKAPYLPKLIEIVRVMIPLFKTFLPRLLEVDLSFI